MGAEEDILLNFLNAAFYWEQPHSAVYLYFLYVIWHLHQGYYQLSSHSFPEQPTSQLNTESDTTATIPSTEIKFWHFFKHSFKSAPFPSVFFNRVFYKHVCPNQIRADVKSSKSLRYFQISIKRDYRLEVSCGWDNRFLSNLLLKQNLGWELIMLPHQTCPNLQPREDSCQESVCLFGIAQIDDAF